MPELPDVVVYVEALERRIVGSLLERVRVASPFVLRTFEPPIESAAGRRVLDVRRMGKRIVLELDGGLFLVIHLMVAGRLRWRKPGAALPRGRGLAAFDFPDGTLLFTEEGKKHRAGLWLAQGEDALAAHDPGGLEPLDLTLDAFASALTAARHTLKRRLTDPHVFSGIGNAYSDEILHAARLSPLQLTTNLDAGEIARLHRAVQETLTVWTDRLRAETADGFPDKVTAFRDEMAVHGRYRKPCPVCGAPVQRIRYAENEVNYCAQCQTGGKVLADRGMSRLLKADWPRSIDEWEGRMGDGRKDGKAEGRKGTPG
ncbi:MAG TPA: DNA-formamidopyrimidine glycosylase family protein [Gemmatimonadales bacterium]